MKLLLVIAIVAVLAVVVLAVQRGGPRITTVDRRTEAEDDREGN